MCRSPTLASHSIKLKPCGFSVPSAWRPAHSPKSSCLAWPRQSVNQWCTWCGPQRGPPPWQDSLSVWTLRWGHNPALQGGHGHRWGSVAHILCCVWSRSWVAVPVRQGRVWFSLFKNGSVFMLTHNDWFHWAPRIITKGFPLLNGNYKRQIDSKQLTSWVKQLSPTAAVGGDAAKTQHVY